jgi:hypothetical protein
LHTTYHTAAAGTTLLVQGVNAQTARVCGFSVNFAGNFGQSVALQSVATTSATCNAGTTQIGSLYTGTGTPSYAGFYNALWGGLAVSAGSGVCMSSSGTGSVDVDIWYQQS